MRNERSFQIRLKQTAVDSHFVLVQFGEDVDLTAVGFFFKHRPAPCINFDGRRLAAVERFVLRLVVDNDLVKNF